MQLLLPKIIGMPCNYIAPYPGCHRGSIAMKNAILLACMFGAQSNPVGDSTQHEVHETQNNMGTFFVAPHCQYLLFLLFFQK
jgi:hypothetical protein